MMKREICPWTTSELQKMSSEDAGTKREHPHEPKLRSLPRLQAVPALRVQAVKWPVTSSVLNAMVSSTKAELFENCKWLSCVLKVKKGKEFQWSCMNHALCYSFLFFGGFKTGLQIYTWKKKLKFCFWVFLCSHNFNSLIISHPMFSCYSF